MVKVPKGTSSYQAAWIVDAPVVDEDDSATDDSDGESMVGVLVFSKNIITVIFGQESVINIFLSKRVEERDRHTGVCKCI